jgi:hypothetical protein
MTAEKPTAPFPCYIFKVGLTVPAHDHISYCVGLGVGPSEDGFREWLHRRMLLSQLPFLCAQVDPVQMDDGCRDLERLMHMVAYAGACSPFRQVFWSGNDVTLPDSSDRFFHDIASGGTVVPGGGCAMLLAGKAVSDLKLAGPLHRSFPGSVDPASTPCGHGQIHGTAKEASLPWMAGLLAMLTTMRRKLACLWMAW